jgi:hypothetical protein
VKIIKDKLIPDIPDKSEYPVISEIMTKWYDFSRLLRRLLVISFSWNPDDRPTFQQICNELSQLNQLTQTNTNNVFVVDDVQVVYN